MRLELFQSLWAMQGLPRREREWTLEQQLDRIAEAGYDGVAVSALELDAARRACAAAIARGLRIVLGAFPSRVSDISPALDLVGALGAEHFDHVNVQADVRPRTIRECLPYLRGWQELADEAGVRIYVETHRDRMTNDLLFTLDLLEAMPGLLLTADLSHYVVGRELSWPITESSEQLLHSILRRSRAFHGRVGTPEQVQVQIAFRQYEPWVRQFASWWRWGLSHLRETLATDERVVFTIELGPVGPPRWYAITGPDGAELSDRWFEALTLKRLVESIWAEVHI